MYLACLGPRRRNALLRNRHAAPKGPRGSGVGFALTFVPVVLVGLPALRLLKVDFGSVSGLLCGSMANPMALNYANDTIEGDNPSVSYATVYPVVHVPARDHHSGDADAGASDRCRAGVVPSRGALRRRSSGMHAGADAFCEVPARIRGGACAAGANPAARARRPSPDGF
ncbi:MAG: hypothetical protein ACLU9X_03325 [Alistipes shahii]